MLTTIHGKQYGFFNRYMPEYSELKKLVGLCETGTPRQVLAQIKASGFDNTLLKHPFLIRENSPIPVHSLRHHFSAACQKQNYSVVRMLLELGMDVDAEWNYTSNKPLRQYHQDDAVLKELFEGGKRWWKVEYPQEKQLARQDELTRHVLNGEASEAAWIMMHGVRLSSPEILATADFGKLPQAFKELVCWLGIPADKLYDYYVRLKDGSADANILMILDTMLQEKQGKEEEIAVKLLLSIDLIGEDKLDLLTSRTFPNHLRIILLKKLLEVYDASEHKCFIEKSIAALFREILCDCWEI